MPPPAEAPAPVADADEPVPLAAAAPPAPAAPFAGTPTTLEEAQGAWIRIHTAIKAKNIVAAAMIKEARITRLAGDDLTITLPASLLFSLKRLEDPKNKKTIDEAVQSVFGRKIAVRLTAESGGAPPPEAKRPATPQDTTADPGVKKILEAFGGSKVVGIE